jgi:peptide/nickel transport system permease protein
MLNFLIRRLIYMVITVLFISFISFGIVELPKGTFLDVKLEQLRQQGGNIAQDQINEIIQRYGLYDPFYVKYTKWITGFVRGDFGQSFAMDRPVKDLIWGRLGFTLGLSLFSLVFSWGISIPLGVYSATHRYSVPDYLLSIFQFVGLAIPSFLLALVLVLFAIKVIQQKHVIGLFSEEFQNAPWSWARLVDMLKHLWIPVLILAVGSTAWLTRVMRGNLLDILNMQYIQTARAKGLAENVVIWKHAVRNALHPLVMALGQSLPGLISGGTVVELVLNLPSAGPLMFQSMMNQDIYLAVTFLTMICLAIVVGNFLADLMLAWVDPRIRLE